MRHVAPHTLETAFVRPGTPMLSELIVRLQEEDGSESGLRPDRRRDMISALRRVAVVLNRTPEAIPADPKWLRPRLSRVAPVAVGLGEKTWSNVLSNLRAAFSHLGVTNRFRRRADLSPAWRRLWERVLASKDPTLQAALGRFVHFVDQAGVAPEEVAPEHALAFREALALSEVSRSPETAYRAAVNGWNLAVERLPDWPRQALPLPSRRKIVSLPLDAFPPTFRADLDAYLTSLQHPDPLDPEGRIEPLRASTVTQYRHLLHRFASILVRAGLPIEGIESLASLAAPEIAKRGFRWMLDRNGGKTSVSIDATARLLKSLGREHARLAPGEQTALEDLARRLALKPRQGLTEKNRQRLRPLQHKATLRRLLQLPDRLVAQAKERAGTYHGALRSEQAVAIAILLNCPIRVGNLTGLHVERNLHRPGDGRTFLLFEADEVKNRQPIEFELPPRIVTLIDEHLAIWQPLLCAGPTPWLFPRRDGRAPMNRSQMAGGLSRRIRKEVGVEFNVHLFRHLAAMIWLDANPGSYEVVRRLLGHAELSRTLNAYAGFEAGTATRLFGEIVEAGRTA